MSVPVPRGFLLAGVHCGIKQECSKEDLTLIVSERPAVAAGVYTQNVVCAAPVAVDRERTPGDNMRLVVVNSGNANACTGEQGLEDARRMTSLAAEACGVDAKQALVMSTGMIGVFLPMDKIAEGIRSAAERLAGDEAAFSAASRGILTTDKSAKTAGRTIEVDGQPIRIAGIAKGAGMIGPKMATMLAVLMTDASLDRDDAQRALADAVDDSFNCISVEGHTSTNDTVLLFANGAARTEPLSGEDLAVFRQALAEVCVQLARQIPADGEGASHLIRIDVQGCVSRDAALTIAKTVADSALVKTAIAGADPNWGRIVSAAGYSGVPFDPRGVQLQVNGSLLYRAGAPVSFDAAAVSQRIKDHHETHVLLEFSEGNASVRFWTSDLTVDYVRFNSDYHT